MLLTIFGGIIINLLVNLRFVFTIQDYEQSEAVFVILNLKLYVHKIVIYI